MLFPRSLSSGRWLVLALVALASVGLTGTSAHAEFILDGTAGGSKVSLLLDLGAGSGTSAPSLSLADPTHPVISIADASTLYIATFGVGNMSLAGLAANLTIDPATKPDGMGVYHTVASGTLPDGSVLHFHASTNSPIVNADVVPSNRSDFPGSVLGVAILGTPSATGLSGEFDLTSATGVKFTFQMHPAPEPTSLALAGLGLTGLVGASLRRRRASR